VLYANGYASHSRANLAPAMNMSKCSAATSLHASAHRACGRYWTEFVPEGIPLLRNLDQPGMIGRVGTILGRAGVNIHRMDVGPRPLPQRSIVHRPALMLSRWTIQFRANSQRAERNRRHLRCYGPSNYNVSSKGEDIQPP